VSRPATPYTPLHGGFFRHYKVRQFADALGIDEEIAGVRILKLLSAAREHTCGGDLSRMRDVDIAHDAGWRGDPAVFVEALVTTGWLDRTDDGHLYTHEGDLYGGKPGARRGESIDGDKPGPKSSTERSRAARARRAAAANAADATDMQRNGNADATNDATLHATATEPEKRREEKREECNVAPQRATLHPPLAPDALRTPFDEPQRKPKREGPHPRGVIGESEEAVKPQEEARIRASLVVGHGDLALSALLAQWGEGAEDQLDGLMADWSNNYDLKGPGSAIAKLRGWVRTNIAERAERAASRASVGGRSQAAPGTYTDAEAAESERKTREALARQKRLDREDEERRAQEERGFSSMAAGGAA
jgi:hypothetical protein